jgi:hypothetical protein
MSVPELVDLSGASTGATYRVVDYLEEQALLERSPRGPIEEVSRSGLIRRWSKDYGFLESNVVLPFLQPRGLTALMRDLAACNDVRYSITGSLAAQQWAPYAAPKAAMLYADDAQALAKRLGLRQVDTGANVLVATAEYEVVFDRTETIDGVVVAAPSQAAVDLMTGPGRNPAEAEALLDWMESHVDSWRR